MSFETILVREDKSKVLLRILIDHDRYYSDRITYRVQVATKAYRKQSWESIIGYDSWKYRKLSTEEREVYIKNKQLEIVTEEEIYQAKLNAWEALKPTMGESK